MADMTRVSMSVRGAEVVTVPIDDTLTIEGQAADAKATGDALALKADKSELQAAVKVNNQPADAQGLILIDGRHIPVSDEDAETLAEAVTDLKGQTAENIPMSSNSGAKTIAEVVNANAEAIESMEEITGATMPIESGSQTTVKAAIEARVKTVNQKTPDADGNVDLSVVPLAENLQSDKMQSVDGTFIIRTTGGSSSVSDGKAYPQHILGTSERTGYVAEELNMTVIPIERTEPDEPITATIDRDVFVAYVDESGTINLYYTTEWSEDPELYGVTVEGTPVAGDQIQIVYVKEQRGTILVSNPERLVGTGWNLFNFNAGYARVVRYSDEYGYKIGGAFTSIEYSATPEGDRVSILPGQNGLFQVPGDGYVFVNGGNATDTYILATWSDWTDGPATGYWEAYKESGIDLSAVMSTYFPYGMLSVGTIHDEIDLSAKRTISRVERMAYTAENLAAAIASGREFTYDTNYIYLVRAENVVSAITIDTVYNVSEHGLEWFTGTTMPLITEILYGKNLRDKLERDVLTISQQTLAEEEKAQVRRNIGVMDPPTNGNGTLGQLMKTNGDGTTEWTTQGTPTDAQVGTAVSAWLTAHPEATTTVQDGAISRAKLNDDLKEKTDAVPELKKDHDDNIEAFRRLNSGLITNNGNMATGFYINYQGYLYKGGAQDTKVFKLETGKKYKITFTGGNVKRYGFSNSEPTNGIKLSGYAEPSASEVTITNTTYQYLYVNYTNNRTSYPGNAYITEVFDYFTTNSAVDAKLSVLCNEITSGLTFSDGYYSKTLYYNSDSDYQTSNLIELESNERIIILAWAYNNAVSIVTVCDSTGTAQSVGVLGKDSSGQPASWYTYTNQTAYKQYVKISVIKSMGKVVYKDNTCMQYARQFFPFRRTGKKVLYMGDSLTALRNYPSLINDGNTNYNVSIPGATIIRYTDSTNKGVSFFDLVTAMVSGDTSVQEAKLAAWQEDPTHNTQAIADMTTFLSLDFSEIDVIVFWFGMNDYLRNKEIGTDTGSDYSQVLPALKYCLDELSENFPTVELYCIGNSYTNRVATSGLTIKDYVDAIKDECEKYGIPFYDMLYNGGVNAVNYESRLDDGIHQNEAQNQIIAYKIANFINK